jgi:hypothetical protein
VVDLVNVPLDLHKPFLRALDLYVRACDALYVWMHGSYDGATTSYQHIRQLPKELLDRSHVVDHETGHNAVEATRMER